MQIFISIQKFTYMMVYSNGKIAGVFFFIAAAQFILGLIVAEALYPGYSISTNYISDLGVGPSSTVFNLSIFLTGLLTIIGTYFLHRTFKYKLVTFFIIIAALAAMGVGIFTENNELMHMFVSFIVFLFSALSAIFSCALIKYPFNIIAVLLGLMSLLALIFYIGKLYLGLGVGGMERMIVYPVLIWMIGFGGFLIALPEKS